MVAPAADKGPEAFRTISEAASELGVPQHVLRFWETKFSFIRPMKRAGGRRFYRRQDIAVLKGVRILLHEEGYTIKGVQRLHKEYGMGRLIGAGEGEPPPSLARPAAASASAAEPFDDEDPEITLQEIARVMGVHRAAAETAEHRAPAALLEAEPEPEPELEPEAEVEPEPEPAARLAPPPRPASILRPDARNRLETVLHDIEGVKAGIDRLLADTDD